LAIGSVDVWCLASGVERFRSCAIAHEVISCLRAREDGSGYVLLDERPKFALGAKVRVLAGVFAENLGLFDVMADRDRIAILLDLLGRKVRVSIEAELVTAA